VKNRHHKIASTLHYSGVVAREFQHKCLHI